MTLQITGKNFYFLRAISKTEKKIGSAYAWEFVCICGKKLICAPWNVATGKKKSCGCMNYRKKENGYKLISKHPLYDTWRGMIRRCSDIKNKEYKNYGGRGIRVCERWANNFYDFVNDVWPKPVGDLTLDRINNNGNYEPGNLRWSTIKVQSRNRRGNKFIENNGETKTIAEWAEIYNIDRSKLRHRLLNNWQFKDAVSNRPVN